MEHSKNILWLQNRVRRVKILSITSRMVENKLESTNGHFLTQKFQKYKIKSSKSFIYNLKIPHPSTTTPIHFRGVIVAHKVNQWAFPEKSQKYFNSISSSRHSSTNPIVVVWMNQRESRCSGTMQGSDPLNRFPLLSFWSILLTNYAAKVPLTPRLISDDLLIKIHFHSVIRIP